MNNRASVRLHPDLMIALQRLAKIKTLPVDVLVHLLISEAIVHRMAKENRRQERRAAQRRRRRA